MADETAGPPQPEEEAVPPPRGLPTHIDIIRVPEHVDIPIHADLPKHFDISHVHSDVAAHADLNTHTDVGHIDIRHMDLPLHTDVGSSGHIDLGHGETLDLEKRGQPDVALRADCGPGQNRCRGCFRSTL